MTAVGRSVTPAPQPTRLPACPREGGGPQCRTAALRRPTCSLRRNRADRRDHAERRLQNPPLGSLFRNLIGVDQSNGGESLVRRRLPADWTARYSITPVLIETFVETPRYTGALYRASGWTHVGTTQGRGRYDRDKLFDKPRKDIWLRPLRRDWQRTLNRQNPRRRRAAGSVRWMTSTVRRSVYGGGRGAPARRAASRRLPRNRSGEGSGRLFG